MRWNSLPLTLFNWNLAKMNLDIIIHIYLYVGIYLRIYLYQLGIILSDFIGSNIKWYQLYMILEYKVGEFKFYKFINIY
jgi:hypothetical protein